MEALRKQIAALEGSIAGDSDSDSSCDDVTVARARLTIQSVPRTVAAVASRQASTLSSSDEDSDDSTVGVVGI